MTRSALLILGIFLPAIPAISDDQPLIVETGRFQAEWRNGSLMSLTDTDGHLLVVPGDTSGALGIQDAQDIHRATAVHGDRKLSTGSSVTRQYESFGGLKNGLAQATYSVDQTTGDLVVSQQCWTNTPGVVGINWSIARIPLEYSIIVPGRSGIRLSATTPGRQHQFDYPMGWEAQLVIVEKGRGTGRSGERARGGFYVWADDVKGRYKRLVVQRNADGWLLEFTTFNNAPFDQETSCRSVAWHVNTYQGDWRVPARKYRNWMTAHLKPVPIESQDPTWVGNTRAVVIMGLDQKMLAALSERLDPNQTVLYIPNWRSAGYDRDYPSYDKPVDKLKPFVDRAHELGFRIMLHVNYFGVDPLNPEYKKFEPYQVRDPWGKHQKLWWHWTRATPEIKFAYINPAARIWRDYFTNAMVRLHHDTGIDALHLDQTLVIYNDHNGLVDGMSMLEGNVALHRQLRRALPDVALSGEGLNEVTYRHEAFAQRHVWGVYHSEGTWDRRYIESAHPICSFLFRPYVVINGYLGCAPPTNGQLYAAWNEAYEYWGVIPTLKPSLLQLQKPTGFSRQFFDEVQCWQQHRLNIDMDSEWPEDVAFPFRTQEGHHAVRTVDERFLCEGHQVSRTITGVNRTKATGCIPGWLAFDRDSIFGLNPTAWYPYFEQPKDENAFHVSAMPHEMIAELIVYRKTMAIVRLSSCKSVIADLVERLDQAEVGSRPRFGKPMQSIGPSTLSDGAQFQRSTSDRLASHPPWKAEYIDLATGKVHHNGTGIAYARYKVKLPQDGHFWFCSDIMMDSHSIGKPQSDGATFSCTVRAGDRVLEKSLHQDTDKPRTLELDLTALAGQTAVVELAIDPGPKRWVSFDWGRWIRPRIEQRSASRGSITVAGLPHWNGAIGMNGPIAVKSTGTGQQVETPLPGSVFFLHTPPPAVDLPLDLTRADRTVLQFGRDGVDGVLIKANAFLKVGPAESVVGGVARHGLFAHPPDNGQTMIHFPMTLPDRPAVFTAQMGIRDGSKSEGVIFSVEVNGRQVAQQPVIPGHWTLMRADLSPWQAQPIVLSLIVDSDGSYQYDWSHWGEPELVAK